MTAPRQVLARRTYLISRRCAQRQYLLRPDAQIESIYLYCLGDAVARYEITLHGYIVMSNHTHLVVRDNEGNLPRFMAHLHKMVAKAVNAHWGRWENVWAAEQPNAVYLVGAHDRFAKLVYLLANPVVEHLVERVADWPGACSLAQHLTGHVIAVKRPSFFRHDGPMPDTVKVRVEPVDGFDHLTKREWADKIAGEVRSAEDAAREERVERKLVVLGRSAVLGASHTDRPATVEPRRGLRPHLACRDVDRRKSELNELRRFRAEHREAILRLRDGDLAAPFPTGTYRMRGFDAP